MVLTLGSVMVLLLLILAGIALLTETGARLVLDGPVRLSGVRLDGVHGRLLGPLRVEHIGIVGLNQKIDLNELDIAWQPARLLHGELHITALRLKSFSVTRNIEQLPDISRLPDRIALPLNLMIDHANVDGGSFSKGPVPLAHFGPLAFALDFNGSRYLLKLERLGAGGSADDASVRGDFSGQASIGVIKPYPVLATISSAASGQFQRRDFAARSGLAITGSLAEMRASLNLSLGQSRLAGQAVLRPFSSQVLGAASLQGSAVDFSTLHAAWPKTLFDLQLRAFEDGHGEFSATNHEAGTNDGKRLPLAGLQIEFAQREQRWLFNKISATLGSMTQPAGTLSGAGKFENGALTLALAVSKLNLQRLDRHINATSIDGSIDVLQAGGKQEVTLALHQPDIRHPLRLAAHATLADATVAIDRAELQVGTGRVDARGGLALNGSQAFQFSGRVVHFRSRDMGDFPNLPTLDLNGDFTLRGTRVPQLAADLSFHVSDSLLAGQPLHGDGEAHLGPNSVQVPKLLLVAGANRLAASGTLSGREGQLAFSLTAPQLALLGPGFDGALNVSGTLHGSLHEPELKLTWDGSHLQMPHAIQVATLQGKGAVRFDTRQAFSLDHLEFDAAASGIKSADQQLDSVTGHVVFATRAEAPLTIAVQASGLNAAGFSARRFAINVDGTTAQHRLLAALDDSAQSWQVAATGGLKSLRPDAQWQGRIERLDGAGTVAVKLLAPAALSIAQQRVTLDDLRLASDGTVLTIAQFLRDQTGIVSRGRVEHLPVSSLLKLVKPPAPADGDLLLGGDWNLRVADAVSGSLHVRRELGDLIMHGSAPVALGLSQLHASIDAVEGRLDGRLTALGRQLGQIELAVQTSAGHGADRFKLIPGAALHGNAKIDIPSLQWLGPALAPALVTAGHLRSAITLDGSVVQPRFGGTLGADGLRVFSPDQGIDLRNGVLESEFQGARLVVGKLHFENADGSLDAHGPINLVAGQPEAQIALLARRFPLLERSDRKLVLSGQCDIGWRDQRARITGNVRVDSGSFDLGRADAPQLSDDVVIVGRVPKSAGRTVAAIDLNVDLGDGVALSGRGLDALMNGTMAVTSNGTDGLRGKGSLTVVKGSYTAYGRKLAIEQGVLRFNGPLNNPALDILAMRRGTEVEAGVAVRGTVLVPRVTLVSEPSVGDAEKLSWLVLGKGLDAAGGGDAGALQAAAASLLSQSAASGVQAKLASAFGLENFSIGKSNDTLQQRIVTLGKQISSRLYVSYEQGLASASNVLHLRYALSPKLTIEAEAGTRSALSLFYNVLFD